MEIVYNDLIVIIFIIWEYSITFIKQCKFETYINIKHIFFWEIKWQPTYKLSVRLHKGALKNQVIVNTVSFVKRWAIN